MATGLPFSVGVNEKSVSWLFSMKPRTMMCEPKYDSMVVVIDNAPPRLSTATICEVEIRGGERSGANATRTPGGVPGWARPMLLSPISAARSAR
ncbi:hypothetical protein D3C86_1295520 [compost metagenome]